MSLDIVSLATGIISTLLWILDKSYLKPKISIYLIQLHRSSTFSIGLMTLNIIKDGLLMGSLYYLGHLIQEFTKERGKIIILSISIKFLQDQLLSSNSSKIIHLLWYQIAFWTILAVNLISRIPTTTSSMPQNCRIKDNILSNCGVESCVKIIIENFYFNHEHKNEVCLNNILNHDQSSTLSSYNLVCVCVCFSKKKKNHTQSWSKQHLI